MPVAAHGSCCSGYQSSGRSSMHTIWQGSPRASSLQLDGLCVVGLVEHIDLGVLVTSVHPLCL